MQALPMQFDPATHCDLFLDFFGATPKYYLPVTLNDGSGAAQIPTTGTAKASIEVPRSGALAAARLVTETGLAVDASNYVTVTILNRLGAGVGAVNVLATTPTGVNSTNSSGGAAITAKVPYPLTVGNAASVNVSTGDVLEVVVTVTGTLGAALANARLVLEVNTITHELSPLVGRTAGLPTCTPTLSSANGEVSFGLTATNEAQYVGAAFNDRLIIPANKQFWYDTRLRLNPLPGANARAVAGLISAFTSVLDDLTLYARFHIKASGALWIESYDGTTRNSVDTGQVLTASSTVYYRLTIDGSNPAAMRFYLNGSPVGADQDATQMGNTSSRLQMLFLMQKDSGTATGTLVPDYSRAIWRRF